MVKGKLKIVVLPLLAFISCSKKEETVTGINELSTFEIKPDSSLKPKHPSLYDLQITFAGNEYDKLNQKYAGNIPEDEVLLPQQKTVKDTLIVSCYLFSGDGLYRGNIEEKGDSLKLLIGAFAPPVGDTSIILTLSLDVRKFTFKVKNELPRRKIRFELNSKKLRKNK